MFSAGQEMDGPMQPLSWEMTLVRVDCALPRNTAALVRRQVSPLLERPGHVILDLRGAKMDSAALGAVLGMQRSLELHERQLLVVADDPGFYGLLDRAEVPRTLPLFRDAGDAVNYLLSRESPPVAV